MGSDPEQGGLLIALLVAKAHPGLGAQVADLSNPNIPFVTDTEALRNSFHSVREQDLNQQAAITSKTAHHPRWGDLPRHWKPNGARLLP